MAIAFVSVTSFIANENDLGSIPRRPLDARANSWNYFFLVIILMLRDSVTVSTCDFDSDSLGSIPSPAARHIRCDLDVKVSIVDCDSACMGSIPIGHP